MSAPHLPVLFEEVMDTFEGRRIQVFIDGTLGAGGHARGILERHPEIITYIGIDQDPNALAIAKENLKEWSDKVKLAHANFSEMADVAHKFNAIIADGILLDIGVSSMQLDTAERGFSINRPGPLDMRMNPESSLSAKDIVNDYSEDDIGYILREYGEEKRWRHAARVIVQARQLKPFETTEDLVKVLMPVLRDPKSKKNIHPLTLVFQALRIAVNDELEVLVNTLTNGVDLLSPGGCFGVISFHSLEDRIVKQRFQYLASDKENTHGIAGMFKDKDPTVRILTRKPVEPTEGEVAINPRARSARFRAVEKL